MVPDYGGRREGQRGWDEVRRRGKGTMPNRSFILLVCTEFLIHHGVLVTADFRGTWKNPGDHMVLLYAFLHVSGFLLGNAFVC